MPPLPPPKKDYPYDVDEELAALREHKALRQVPDSAAGRLLVATWNVANFGRQVERAGLMIDWRMQVDTTTPEYYRWTQWVFLKLLERGLAYKKSAAVNWCPTDKTVLANEQVEGGLCERCGRRISQERLAALPAATICIRCANARR